MIETPQWFARLAEKVDISYENAKELQKSFSTLTSNRLTKGLDAVLPFVGRLSTVLRHEFVAELSDGSKYIVPPRVMLVLSPYEGQFPGLPGEVLIESSRLTEEAVRDFLKVSGELLAEYIALGETVCLSGIGTVGPEKGGGSFSFIPASTLLEAINNPFSAYEVVLLSKGKDYPHLSHISFDSREAINEIKPLYPMGERKKETELPLPPEKPQEISTQEGAPASKDGQANGKVNSPPMLPSPMLSDQFEAPQKAPLPELPPALPPSSSSVAEPPAHPCTELMKDPCEAPAVLAEEAEDETVPDEEREKKRSSKGWLPILLIILVVAFLVGVAIFFYSEASQSGASSKKPKQRTEKEGKVPEKAAATDAHTTKSETVEKQDNAPSAPRYITVQPNERLVDIALRECGYKSFWVYIYEENRDAIVNPDRVPPGTRLKLPDEKEYGIDRGSAQSREKADSLQLQYNRRKGRA